MPENESKYERVRRLLLLEWDPIGVSGFPGFDISTDDEYDGYARRLTRLLKDGADTYKVASYLNEAAKNMGLKPDRKRTKAVAAKLTGLRN